MVRQVKSRCQMDMTPLSLKMGSLRKTFAVEKK